MTAAKVVVTAGWYTLYPGRCWRILSDGRCEVVKVSGQDRTAAVNHDAQADWFVREVKRCREIGMPLGCCEDWPECAHVLAWMEERDA